MLDYEFHQGFGSPGCDAIYAWTKNKVAVAGEYDGSAGVEAIPRNPAPGAVRMVS